MGITRQTEPDSNGRCLNCGAQLTGPYCAQCGQRTQDPDPTFRELVAEAWDAFVSVDGKAMSSLRLLMRRPGVLTRQYLMGHRARFVPPLRLYLLCSVAFFLVSAVDPPARGRQGQAVIIVDGDTMGLQQRSADSVTGLRQHARDSAARALLERHGFAPLPGPIDSVSRMVADSLRAHDEAERFSAAPRWLRRRYERSFRHIVSEHHNFSPQISEQAPRLMFVLVPVFALLLGLAYRSRGRRYPVHLVTALHLHAFAYVALTSLAVLAWLPWSAARTALSAATALWMVAYIPIALREVYGGRLRGAIARSALLAVEYAVIGLAAFMVLLLLLVLSY